MLWVQDASRTTEIPGFSQLAAKTLNLAATTRSSLAHSTFVPLVDLTFGPKPITRVMAPSSPAFLPEFVGAICDLFLKVEVSVYPQIGHIAENVFAFFHNARRIL